jgi:hypothetical protein
LTTTTESISPDGVGWRCILIVLDGIVILTVSEVVFLPVLLIFIWEVGIIVNIVVVVDNGSRIPPMPLLGVDTTGFDLAPRTYAQRRIRLLSRTTATKQRMEVKAK